MRKRLLILAVTCLGLAAAPAGSAATTDIPQGGGAVNVVLASTTSDGARAVRSALQVTSIAGPTVASSNIADATATACTGCHASAVAVQVVFVTGVPQFYVPGNAAVAANGGCTACGTYAYAWQYLLQTPGPVHLSPAGQQRITDLRQQIANAAASILPSDVLTDPCFTLTGPPYPCETRDQQLDAALDALTAQVKDVVDTELQAAGIPASGAVLRDVQQSPAL